MPAISVIISNFNGAKYLPRLLASLRAQQGVALEIIVVDRHSADDSARILAAHPEVQVVAHPPETGLVSGYAAGCAVASHDLLFFMNEDMWLEPHCLERSVEVLQASARAAAVMPVQWTYDGAAIVNAGIWFERSWWNRANPSLFRRSRWHLVGVPARVAYANAGACLFRRSAYEDAGGWDSSFFLDDEDTDIGIRLWQRGWECWVAPEAILGHAVGASNAKPLPSTGATVSRKRYVGGLSNFLVLAFKTFSAAAWVRPVLALLDRMLRNLLKGRWALLGLDVQAIGLTLRRLPDIVEYRRKNRALNRSLPGQGFFAEPLFQWQAIRGNTSERRDACREASLSASPTADSTPASA